MWTGVKFSQQDHVALLVCVALNGYHSVVSYQWSEDGVEMKGETYPLLYTSVIGKYTCRVTSKMKVIERHFETRGIIQLLT